MDQPTVIEPQKPPEEDAPKENIDERTPIDVEKELKFTGFKQSKESGINYFIKKHKIRVLLASFVVIIGGAVGILVLVSSGENDEEIQKRPQSTKKLAGDELNSGTEIVDDSGPIDFTKSAYSLSTNGDIFELIAEDKTWLARSEFDWTNYVSWGDWLFYSANKTPEGDGTLTGLPTVIGIEAFNYQTKEHKSLAKLGPPDGSGLNSPMYVEGDYLFVSLSGFKTKGTTHRCKLNESNACDNMDLFYDGAGKLSIINDETVFVSDGVGDAGVSTTSIRKFNPKTNKTTDVVELRSAFGIGKTALAFGSDSLVWITEVNGDELDAQKPGYDGAKFVRLYAVDSSGAEKFVLPAQAFPILSPVSVKSSAVEPHQILFANGTQEVIFDVETKQFGPTQQRELANKLTKINETIDDLISRLKIPENYEIKSVSPADE